MSVKRKSTVVNLKVESSFFPSTTTVTWHFAIVRSQRFLETPTRFSLLEKDAFLVRQKKQPVIRVIANNKSDSEIVSPLYYTCVSPRKLIVKNSNATDFLTGRLSVLTKCLSLCLFCYNLEYLPRT